MAETALILAGISLAGTAILAIKDVAVLVVERLKMSECCGMKMTLATPAVERKSADTDKAEKT